MGDLVIQASKYTVEVEWLTSNNSREKIIKQQDKMKDHLRRESVVDIQDDGDPYWFNNPQYRLSVDEVVEVRLSLRRTVTVFPDNGETYCSYLFVGETFLNQRLCVAGVHQPDAAG